MGLRGPAPPGPLPRRRRRTAAATCPAPHGTAARRRWNLSSKAGDLDASRRVPARIRPVPAGLTAWLACVCEQGSASLSLSLPPSLSLLPFSISQTLLPLPKGSEGTSGNPGRRFSRLADCCQPEHSSRGYPGRRLAMRESGRAAVEAACSRLPTISGLRPHLWRPRTIPRPLRPGAERRAAGRGDPRRE